MIKNIVFDVGGVIILGKPENVVDKMNITLEEKEEILDKFFHNFDNWRNLDLGLLDLSDLYNEIDFSFKKNEKIKDILIHSYKYRDINIELLDYMKELKEKYNLIILSDMNKDYVKYLKEELLKNIVSNFCFSSDFGKTKENGELFDILINDYSIKPSESLFIDDREKNISIANSKGFNTFLFNNNIKELKDTIKNINL